MTRSVPLSRVVGRLRAEGLLATGDGYQGGEVVGVTADSRRVEPGWLFCALAGTGADGHDFVTGAARRRAAAVLVERRVKGVGVQQIRVTDGRLAAAFAAAEFFADPWQKMTVIGVTGTNGKTTTVSILRHLLAGEGAAVSLGTLGVVAADGEVLPGTEGLTTPGPVEVAWWLARFAADGVKSVAMEVSSHGLDQKRAAAIRFDAAVFTNLGRDHLDYHRTVEHYRNSKLGLLGLLKQGGVAVLNCDDPVWGQVNPPPPLRAVRFGISSGAEVRAQEVHLDARGSRWTLRTPDGQREVRAPFLGMHNVSNALAAVATARALGGKVGPVANRLRSAPQIPGRLERVESGPERAAVVIDFAHTAEALRQALETLRPLTRGRLLVVFGAGGDRDPGKRPELGRVAAGLADFTVVTSDNPRSESPEHIAGQIEKGMGDAPRVRVLDRSEAIRYALAVTGPGDTVLLAGKGHERYQLWNGERRPLDEREVVRRVLEESG
ncbi:MAG: UDP-N-acetylmuramoyl-L-alanyl-D-glutamate--2,6-diaminopimelate ligase [Longimicrobiaceae bacterium]